jgi:hypothetical protein
LGSSPQNNLISALLQLKESTQRGSITGVLKCQTVDRRATSLLKQLSAAEIRESLLLAIENELRTLPSGQTGSGEELAGLGPGKEGADGKDYEEMAKQYLQRLVRTTTAYLQ